MIHWQYLSTGKLFYVKYYFMEEGDILPAHVHGEDEAHNVIVIQGLVEVKVGDITHVCAPSSVLDLDCSKIHTVEARHPRSITLHGYYNGRPYWYDGLATSGSFPAEAAAPSPSAERQGSIGSNGSHERRV